MGACCKKVTAEEETSICSRYLDDVIAAANRLASGLGRGNQHLPQSEVVAVLTSGLLNGAYMQMSESKDSALRIGGVHQTLINEGDRKIYGFNDWLKRHASCLQRVEERGSITALTIRLGDRAAAYRSATAFAIGEMLSCNGGEGANLAEKRILQDELITACSGLRSVLDEIYGKGNSGSGCLPVVVLLATLGGLLTVFV